MTPSRRTAGSFLAAAVVVAVLAVPGPAAAAASVHVTTWSEYDDTTPGAPHHIAGEVENNGTTNLTSIAVTLRLLDGSGQELDSVVRTSLLQVLAPGERSGFGYGFTPPAGYDHAEVASVTGQQTTSPPNHRFTVDATAMAPDGAGYREISGTIRNDNTATAEDVRLALTFYDATDRVVGVAASQPDDGAADDTYDDLAAGQTKPFQATLVPGFPAFTRLAAVAESATPPSPLPSPSASPSSEPSPSPSASPSASPSVVPSASPSTSPSPMPSAFCAPELSLSSNEITVGEPVEAIATGTPGATVVLEAYSRPVSTYAPVRPETVLGSDGTARFTIGPSTNTRLQVRRTGCDTPSLSQLLRVHPVLTFAVRRDGVRRYTFTGRILPGEVNVGRGVALVYQLPGSLPVRRAAMTVGPGGAFSTTVTFGGSARLDVWVRTGVDTVNEDGRSNARSLLVY